MGDTGPDGGMKHGSVGATFWAAGGVGRQSKVLAFRGGHEGIGRLRYLKARDVRLN